MTIPLCHRRPRVLPVNCPENGHTVLSPATRPRSAGGIRHAELKQHADPGAPAFPTFVPRLNGAGTPQRGVPTFGGLMESPVSADNTEGSTSHRQSDMITQARHSHRHRGCHRQTVARLFT